MLFICLKSSFGSYNIIIIILTFLDINGLIRKPRLISKFVTNSKLIITLHILPNISRSKGSQTLKFGQLKTHKNHTQNMGKNLVPDTFLKTQNLTYCWINSLKFCTVWFYFVSKSRTTKIYWKLRFCPLTVTLDKAVWKTKRYLN